MVKRILVVEDNEIVRELIVRRLRRRGYQILTAVNGLDAIEKAKAEQPDIILMDMSLPLLDGWRATAKMRTIFETTLIPVIALTAHAMAGDRERALAAGCNEYETKPVDFERLVEKIERLVPDK